MLLDHYKATLLTHLAEYQPIDATEADHHTRLVAFLSEQAAPFSRGTLSGHITGSAILIDEKAAHLALIWHRKLERWLQPGGHCEDTDPTLPEAAWRELIEETGLARTDIRLVQPTPFDVDVHEIPARGEEPTHFHYDVRYLFQTQHDLLPQNGGCQWRSVAEIAQLSDVSRARYARKIMLKAGGGLER